MALLIASIKKHRILLLLSIVFLCSEAIFCIAAPAVLGEIINTGIQGKGITDSYPRVMSRDTFALFYEILPAEKQTVLADTYILSEAAPDEFAGEFKSNRTHYCLSQSADAEKAAELYRNAVWSAILMARNTDGFENYNYDELINRVSVTTLYALSKNANLSKNEIVLNYAQAEKTGNALKMQAATILMPYIYEAADIDCDALQVDYINKKVIEMTLYIFLQLLCAAGSAYVISRFSAKAEEELRTALLEKTLRFSRRELTKMPADYLAETVQNGVRQIGMAVNYGLRPLIYAPVLGIAGSIIVFNKSALFGFLIAFCSILITAVVVIIYLITCKRYYRMQEKYENYVSSLRHNFRHFLTIRGNNAQSVEEKNINDISESIRKDESFVMKAVLNALSITGLIINALTAAVVIAGGKTMLNLELNIGDIITFLQYSVMIVTSFMMLGTVVIFAPKALKALKDIDRINNTIPHNDIYCDAAKKSPEKVSCVTYDRVRLFEKSTEISFTAVRGEITLITGKTGSGKSLLIDSLTREYTPAGGKILINGENIEDFNSDYPADKLSVAKSKPVLFTDTLRNNLLLRGAEDNDDTLLAALQAAQCDFLELNANVLRLYMKNSGEMFSGGQRSRISLAGTFAKKSDIYIFDDCFSSVDDETKKHILEHIKQLKKDAVVLMISGGETEARYADKTIVI